jgi:multidrug resistance efflux pump
MRHPVNPAPACRADLVIRPASEPGQYVVKDPRTGDFYTLGQLEHFLLRQLDGKQPSGDICARFEEAFGQPLPLLKLDGYYLLSDWLELPNLRQRALDAVMGRLRWLLWGAVRPADEARGGLLLGYGLTCWLFSLGFVALTLVSVVRYLGPRWGLVGTVGAGLLAAVAVPGLFPGFARGEVSNMIRLRRKRVLVWLGVLGAVPTGLWTIPWEERSGGPFVAHARTRAEVRAPVAGFIREVWGEEGERVSGGAPLVRLEVPDLESRLAQKRAAVCEVRARLRLLEAGSRTEEVAEQRRRVHRAREWKDRARRDRDRARQVMQEELAGLEELVAQCRAEAEHAGQSQARAQRLQAQHALADEQRQEAEKQARVARARLEHALAQRRSRQAQGTREAETELAQREKDWAEAQATLRLLEAGARPEELEAMRARRGRLAEEQRYRESVRDKSLVASPVAGVLMTPRLREKVGQYVREGDVLCLVEEPGALRIEITLPEEEAARAQAGQVVGLKPRALPGETLWAQVEQVASRAEPGDGQATLLVTCGLEAGGAAVRPGMTGFARVYTGRRPLGEALAERLRRFLGVEFWW